MKPFRSAALFAPASPWTCRQCLRKQRQLAGPQRFLTQSVRIPRRTGRKRAVLLAAAGGTLGAGAFAFTDDVKHGYAAVERTSRVASTLAVCMNE